MAVQHVYSNAVADGTATSVVRPSDWNSYHNQYITLVGNTAGQSTISGTNIAFQGGNGNRTNALTIRYGLYEYGTGSSSNSIQSIATSSFYMSMSNATNASVGFTIDNSVTSFTTTSAGTNIFATLVYFGLKYLYLPFTTTLNAGNEYFICN